ncbi:DUF2156 domain-containing protein [candidate division WWE3 bacterium]|nr:DUF2156 domain-containing protein [candidate division WWE3 bacterium]
MPSDFPTYPKFKIVSLDDYDIFSEFESKFPAYSDFNLLSVLSWNVTGLNSYSILNGNLVLRIKDYLGEGFLHSVLGDNNMDMTMKTLLYDLGDLFFVPETSINSLKNKSDFNIESNRDNDDYVLSTELVTKLDGAKFRDLRQDVAKFKRLYPSYEVKLIDLQDKHSITEVTNLNGDWFKHKSFDLKKQDEEHVIYQAFFKYYREFNCINLGIFIDSKLSAYVFSEVIPSKMVIAHFSVSSKEFVCSSKTLFYETCSYLDKCGYKYLNLEQDTGLAGLRKLKLSFNPEYFLKKFNVSLR